MQTIAKPGVEILYAELSYKITGLCFQVQKDLGRFAKEKQYCDRLEIRFREESINYKREFTIIGTGNRVDFIVEDGVVLEIKAVPFISKDEYYQTQRYLKILDLKLGLLINFQSKYLKPQRVINFTMQDSQAHL